MSNRQRSSQGFSIVIVLVAAALLGILALAFSEMIGGAMKGQKSVQNAVDFDVLKTSLNMVLSTRACDGAFKNSGGSNVSLSFAASVAPGTNVITTPLSVTKVLQGSTPIADLSSPNLGGGMKLTKLEFVDAIYDGDQSVSGTLYKAFVATLRVVATKQSGSYGAPGYSKDFSVRILANAASGLVEKCGSPQGTSLKSCGPNATNTAGIAGEGLGALMQIAAFNGGSWSPSGRQACCYLVTGMTSTGTCGWGAGGVCWICHDMLNWSSVNPT